ncbi:uncharacterized protein MELLADRAFT_88063 [Melampsora larici-populina 98AG31]|uniref:Uncharacterized protein n=1 Tax=Melampsora larici-populina (strain 98AG31 / pathotype 3-4-7) TaxID=747676 RepID=F4RQA8_MELLP|nr:uncharacterized protein MELLADRAFT_88063 [Melampsora larici-populina 98AG31]EGG05372.1 hypothetical protein MELLADRAFT_88063 [Melampsora larici-populina 98AG31]
MAPHLSDPPYRPSIRTTTQPFTVTNALPRGFATLSGLHRTTHQSFRSDYSKAFTFKPTLDPFHSDYSRSIMQNFSQAQINLDDTPIGQRPYPSTRRALAAAAVDHVSETTASVGDCSSSLPLADVIFGPPVARDPSPAASSDIEIVSLNLPPRVPLSDKKPGMHSFCFRPLGSHILTFKTFVCGLVLQPSGARVTTPQPLSVAYTMCLLKGTDITKGPAKKNAKPVYSTIPIPATKKPFDLNETSLAKGNTAILQTADAMKQVKIYAFITAHDTWAKNQERTITEDIHVSSFFQSVLGALGKHAGFVIVMDNPARCAQEAIDANFARFFLVQELTKNQARLRAQNTLNNVVTTASDLAHATPVDPHSRWLTALQDHHGSLKNNKAEGWRIFNPKDLTLKMELTFHHLILWARELVKGTRDVTIDDPPMELEEFFWIDVKPVKRPSLATPTSVAKKIKVEEASRPSELGSYAEMQSSTVSVDFKNIRRIEIHSTLQQYLTWCEIDYNKIDDYVQIFFKHLITSFHRFLFPSVLSAKTIASWGIPYGVVMELMTRPREYYTFQVNKLEELMTLRAMRAASAEAHGDNIDN